VFWPTATRYLVLFCEISGFLRGEDEVLGRLGFTQRIFVTIYQYVGRLYRSHFQGSSSARRTVGPLKTGPLGCTEKSVTNYQHKLRNDPEEKWRNILIKINTHTNNKCRYQLVLFLEKYKPFFCDELITRPEQSCRLWCVVVCDLETSWMMRPWPTGSCRVKNKQTNRKTTNINLFSVFHLFGKVDIFIWKIDSVWNNVLTFRHTAR
jgi:hypothetical protein